MMDMNIRCQYCAKSVLPANMHVVIQDRFGYGVMETSIHCNECYEVYLDLVENPVEY